MLLFNNSNHVKNYHGTRISDVVRNLMIVALYSFSVLNLDAQYEIDVYNGLTVSTCSGTFYDSGGAGNYTQNEANKVTFCSSSGEAIRLFFHNVSIRSRDTLYVYDGPNDTSPLIGSYSDGTSASSPVPDFTVTSSGTCLTFKFKSDGTFDRAGWVADISCVSCPPLVASPISPSNNEVCVGSTINYSVVDRPGSSYAWTVDDGTPTSFIGGSNLDVTWNMTPGATGQVTVVETSACGSTASSSLSVDLYPLPSPVITGTAVVCPNTPGVTYSTPLDTDNTYSWSVTGGLIIGPANTSSVTINWGSIGSGTVSVTETTLTGCSATVNYLVTIQDLVAPVISGCPVDISINTPVGTCANTATWTEPTATDNCDGSITYTTRSHAPGSTFSSGVTAVTYTFTDASGNTSTCSFNVTVNDNQNPVAVCKNITVILDAFNNATITGTDIDGGSTDNCGITLFTALPSTFNASNIGANNVTLTVADANGNSNTCTAIVTVVGNTPPVAICRNITVQLNGSGNVTISAINVDNGSNDPDGIASYSIDKNTFTCSDVGANTVILTVTDNAGMSSNCTSTVTVQDNILPLITCPGNMIFTADLPACRRVVNYVAPVVSDNCSISGIIQTSGFASGSAFPVGTTTNTFLVTDINGNTASCSFNITISSSLDINVATLNSCNTIPGIASRFESTVSGGVLPYTYFWDGLDDAVNPFMRITLIPFSITTSNTSTLATPLLNPLLPDGNYSVQLTVTDALGCTDSYIINFTKSGLTSNNVSNESSDACDGETVTYTVGFNSNATYAWQVTNGTIVAPSTTNVLQVIWNMGFSGGTVTTNISQPTGFGTCESSVINTVTINPLPATGLTVGGTSTICTGTGTNVTVASSEIGVSYQLRNGVTDVGIPVAGNGGTINLPTGILASTTTFNVTATNLTTNCFSQLTGSAVVTVAALPAPTISGLPTVCINSSGNIYTTESGMTGYVWTVVGGNITSGGTGTSNTTTVTWTSSGVQLISVNYSNPSGCTSVTPTVFNVTVVPLPAAPTIIPGGPVTLCSGQSTTLTSSAGTSYLWSTGATTQSILVSSPGSYSVQVSDVNNCLSPSSAATLVTVQIIPGSGAIGGNQTICNAGDPLAFTSTAAGTGSGIITYRWESNTNLVTPSWSNIAGATSATYDVPAGLIVTTQYRRITVSTLNGVACESVATASVTVSVQSIPTAGGIGTDQTICNAGDPLAFTSTTAGTGSGIITYRWESNTNLVTPSWSNIAGATSATYDVPAGLITTTQYRRITVSTLNGVACESVATALVTVTVQSVVTSGAIGTDQTICNAGDPLAFTSTASGTGSGLITYRWESNTNLVTPSWTTIAGAASSTYDVLAGLVATTQYRRITVSTQDGVVCESVATAAVTVTVQSIPTAGAIGSNQSICGGAPPAPLTSTTDGTGSGVITYEWQSDPGTGYTIIAGAVLSTYTPGTPATTTSYRRRTVSVSGGATCYSAYTAPVTLTVGANPTATISPVAPQTCAGIPIPLTATPSGGSGIYTIHLWTGAGATNLNDPNIQTPTFNSGTAGLFPLTYTVTDNRGCTGTANTTVTVNPVPSATISYAGAPFCNTVVTAQPVTITGTAGGTFTASPSGLSLDPATGEITPSISTPATYTVTYTIAAAGGCSIFTTTANLTITALPTVTISYLASPFCVSNAIPQNVTINGTAAYLGGIYSAGAGLTLNTSTGAITPSTSIPNTYTVTYITPASGGCVAVSTTTSVTVSSVPTATISYSGLPYCTSVSSAQPVTLSGTGLYTGGSFTSNPAGLSIDGTTGAITPSLSNAGVYTVNYFTSAVSGCAPVLATTSVTITELPTASINYTGGPFCTSVSGDIPVNLTGTGLYTVGTFSSSAGLTINALTGAITPSSSSDGTYIITYTIPASGGCPLVTTTTSVTITALPTATISYSSPFCSSLTTSQLVALAGTGAFSGGVFSASPSGLIIDSGDGSITPSGSTAGSYTITYDIPASGGCASVPVTTTLIITEAPTVSISYADPFCSSVVADQPVNLTGTGAYTGGSFIGSSPLLDLDSFTGDVNPANSTAGVYTVAYISPASGGCAPVLVFTTVTITEEPSATISYAGDPYCSTTGAGQAVTLTGTSGGSYSALPAGLDIDSVTGAINPSLSIPGTYTITYTILASGGCLEFSTTTQVTITEQPSATISYAGTPYCKSDATTRPVTLTGTTGGTFTAPAGLDINAFSGDITPVSSLPGIYVVDYSIAPLGGCLAITATTSVTISSVPVLVINDPAPVCSPATVDLTDPALTAGSDAGLNYSYWTNAAATIPYPTPATATTGLYYIMGLNPATNCYNIKSVLVIVVPIPSLVITDPAPVCSPATVDLTDASITAGSDAGLTLTYWTDAGATIPYATPATASSGIYYIQGDDGWGCPVIKPVNVVVNPSLSVSGIQTDILCKGGSTGAIDITVTGGTIPFTFTWTGTGIVSGSEDQTGLTAGTYSVIVSDANSCSSTSLVITLTEPAQILSGAIISQTNVTVFGGSDGSVDVSGSGGTGAYQYRLNGGANQASGAFSSLTAGAYTVTVEDANLCTFNVAVTITQPPAPLSGGITVQSDVKCFGTATGSVTVEGAGGVTPYEYKLDAGVYQPSGTFGTLISGSYTVTIRDALLSTFDVAITISQPSSAVSGSITDKKDVLCFGNATGSVTVAGTGGVSPYQYQLGTGAFQASGVFTALTGGSYTVTVQDANMCTVNVAVTIDQPLTALTGTITSQSNASCTGSDNGSVTVTGAGGVAAYEYRIDNGTYQVSGTFSSLSAGSHTVTVRDANLCTADISVIITQPPALVINYTTKPASCPDVPDGSISLTISGGTPPYKIIWLDGITTIDRPNIPDGTYSVVVTDANGCAEALDIIVENTGSSSCVVAQEIITPNNDGFNDTWKIRNIDLFPDAEVLVYNRWGKLVFKTKNISDNEWDGTMDGKLLPTDSYHYILYLNDGSEPRSGVISIIR